MAEGPKKWIPGVIEGGYVHTPGEKKERPRLTLVAQAQEAPAVPPVSEDIQLAEDATYMMSHMDTLMAATVRCEDIVSRTGQQTGGGGDIPPSLKGMAELILASSELDWVMKPSFFKLLVEAYGERLDAVRPLP